MTVTFPLPVELQGVGRVKGRFILVSPDTINDLDVYPEARASSGTVTFTPASRLTKTTNYAAVVGHPAKTFPVDSYGVLQDEELSGGVWLREDTYLVSYSLQGMTIAPHSIVVTSAYTDESPLILSAVIPEDLPAGTTIAMLEVPLGAVQGQVLGWDSEAGLVWQATAVSVASTTIKGVVELATSEETVTGEDDVRATTPAGVKAALDAKAASDMSTYVAQANLTVTPGASIAGMNTGDEPLATEVVAGTVRLAPLTQATAGESADRAITPAGVRAYVDGLNLSTVQRLTNLVPGGNSMVFTKYDNKTAFSVDLIQGHSYYTTRAFTVSGGAATGVVGSIRATGIELIPYLQQLTGSGSHVTTIDVPTLLGTNLLFYGSTTAGTTIEFTDVCIIDLTATFGAGNEPSKASMDTIIENLGAWFDGTQVVYNAFLPQIESMQNTLAYQQVGTGSPYGVITPTSAGIEYTDVAQTNGAQKWISTGTSPTSWQVINGDTGWISVLSLLLNGWTASGAFIRRTGDRALVRIYNLDPASATNNMFLTLPAGFYAGGGVYFSVCDDRIIKYSASGALSASRTEGAIFTGGYGYLEIPLNARTWPTTLP